MPSAILISYDFAPIGSPGSMRASNLARDLAGLGWRVCVITPRNAISPAPNGLESLAGLDNVTVLRTREIRLPNSAVRNLSVTGSKAGRTRWVSSLARKLIFPDRTLGWYPGAISAANAQIRKHRPDVMYSTYPEITNHFIACRLSKIHKLPWLAEFRDPWSLRTTPKWNQAGVKNPALRTWIEKKIERKFIEQAQRVVVVTDTMADDYLALHPAISDKLNVVNNGYDETSFSKVHMKPLIGSTLRHAGSLYGGNRNPTPLLEALSKLRNRKHLAADFGLEFIGTREPQLVDLVEQAGMSDITEFTGRKQYSEVARRLAESSANVIIDGGLGNLPTKLFDYIGARRPILAICPTGSELSRFVREKGFGEACENNITAIEKSIISLRERETNFRTPNAGEFTRLNSAKKIDQLFRGMVQTAL